jgi:NAD(P)-dependent dehydrogenase (short-subunit alcohol dehydrogenase family)
VSSHLDIEQKPITDPFSLVGKVALVTGGSRGLGREMVSAFARAGADVVIVSRSEQSCRELALEIERETGRSALPIGAHVGRWDELPALVDTAYRHFGHVDILVNNAGKSPVYESLGDIDEQLWDSVFAVNLKGPFRLTALIAKRMIDAGTGGSVINISSVAAAHPRPHMLPYAAAKAGLNTITASLAHAFGPTVRVNAIMAGPFFTDASKSWDIEKFTEAARSHALGRGGQPSEIVGAALYFASSASSYTTGSVLTVDGGLPL